jgi:hypothetical protein
VQKARSIGNLFLALIGLLTLEDLSSAHAAPLPAVDPSGEQFLEAILVNDGMTNYSGGKSFFSWGSYPIIVVTAQKYFADYQSNQIAADQKYQNMAITISGTIDSINNDQLIGPSVSFAVDGPGNGVYANLDPTAISEAGSYQPGQTISLFCRSAGILVGIPQLKQCVGKQTLTARLHQDIHTDLESWLTGGQLTYANNPKSRKVLFLLYEGGKIWNPNDPNSNPDQIILNRKRLIQILQIGVRNPDADADAAFLGVPLKSFERPFSPSGSQ